jgi:hypothetical protein
MNIGACGQTAAVSFESGVIDTRNTFEFRENSRIAFFAGSAGVYNRGFAAIPGI